MAVEEKAPTQEKRSSNTATSRHRGRSYHHQEEELEQQQPNPHIPTSAAVADTATADSVALEELNQQHRSIDQAIDDDQAQQLDLHDDAMKSRGSDSNSNSNSDGAGFVSGNAGSMDGFGRGGDGSSSTSSIGNIGPVAGGGRPPLPDHDRAALQQHQVAQQMMNMANFNNNSLANLGGGGGGGRRGSLLHRKTPSLSSYQTTPISKHYELNKNILAAFESHYTQRVYRIAYAMGLQVRCLFF